MNTVSGLELPPNAPKLMNSMRALGYTVEAAIADLIDNSITAESSSINVDFSIEPEPHLIVSDDGMGMSESVLVKSMRFGSEDPRSERHEGDLGRFGLGLKTASLSQCRKLTVISKTTEGVALAEWDLDECERRGTWWLSQPLESEIPKEMIDRLESNETGTVVLWRNMDRLLQSDTHKDIELDKALANVTPHLAFTFHRFVDPRADSPIDIAVNGRLLPQRDPFLEGHPKGQMLYEDSFKLQGSDVHVAPFVLPYPSKLSELEIELAGGLDRVKSDPGFYIYRGKRLVVPGGWFRIVPSDELMRLARVRVDVPIELDHIWKLDIRKTVVQIPRQLRPFLRNIVGEAVKRSRRVYQFRGNREVRKGSEPIWERVTLRDNAVKWQINRSHPIVQGLSNNSGRTDAFLKAIEESFPIHDVHVHLANDVSVAERGTPEERSFRKLAQRLIETLGTTDELKRQLLDNLPNIEPFADDQELAMQIAEELR